MEQVRYCREEQVRHSRSAFTGSTDKVATYVDEDNERVCAVKLTTKCEHDPTSWSPQKCGHNWCEMCQGHVDPVSKVVLTSAGPIVTCNRLPRSEYTYLFREGMAGSEHLTQAMQRKFGKNAIEEASDIIKGPDHDLRTKWVYEREKKRVKSRQCLIDHWSPNCRTASRANRQPLRWKDEPYGHVQIPKLMDDSVLMVRVAKLALMKHMVGDFFGIEHIYPTPMLEMDSYKELLATPGVFVLTWDNCEYGETYVHRQCYITNMWFLARMSRDCSNRVVIAQGGALPMYMYKSRHNRGQELDQRKMHRSHANGVSTTLQWFLTGLRPLRRNVVSIVHNFSRGVMLPRRAVQV